MKAIGISLMILRSNYKMLFGKNPTEIHMHPDDFNELCKSAEASIANKSKKKKQVTSENIDEVYGMKAFQSYAVAKRKFHFEPTNQKPVMSLGLGQLTNITLPDGRTMTAIPVQQRKGMKISIRPEELRPVVEDVLRQIAQEELSKQHLEKVFTKTLITPWQRLKMWARGEKL